MHRNAPMLLRNICVSFNMEFFCRTNIKPRNALPVMLDCSQYGGSRFKSITDAMVIFDAEMNLQAHIRKVCQVSYMHLRNIASIRPALTDKAAECLIHAFITSRLDCCNSLLAGLPGTTLGKLQSIQNAAARLLTGTRKYDHITPVLRELNWLPITSRIQYKVTLLVYKTLHGPAPQYLQDLIQYRSARPGLRSAGILLNVPMTRSVTYGDRAFCSIGPTWWNSLPSELKTSPSVDSFKRNLKTHLFKLAYGQ